MSKLLNNFSPNMLKTFDECQMKFFLKYIQKFSVPQNSKLFEKGKKIHALASYYLNGENIEKLEKTLNSDEKTAWESLKSNKYFNLTMLNTEYNLSCKIGSHWIGGRLDAFMKDGKNYFILDYKTGNIPKNPEQDFQTIVYLLCADKFLHHKKMAYDSLQFVYIGLKKEVETSILLDEAFKNRYEQKIIATCKKNDLAANSTVFIKNLSACENCEYNKICK